MARGRRHYKESLLSEKLSAPKKPDPDFTFEKTGVTGAKFQSDIEV